MILKLLETLPSASNSSPNVTFLFEKNFDSANRTARESLNEIASRDPEQKLQLFSMPPKLLPNPHAPHDNKKLSILLQYFFSIRASFKIFSIKTGKPIPYLYFKSHKNDYKIILLVFFL